MKKKEIENLSTSHNDTQARSQSLNAEVTLDLSNSQDAINNPVTDKSGLIDPEKIVHHCHKYRLLNHYILYKFQVE